MRPRSSSRLGNGKWHPPLLAAFVPCLLAFACGCGDSCFLFVSNSNSGTVGVAAGSGDSSCRITKPMGAVQFSVGAFVASNPETGLRTGSGPAPVAHIFVTLRGIEGHEDASAPMDSPAWQELAPGLAVHPVQIDLLGAAEQSALLPASPTERVPAGVYRQIRLLLLPPRAAEDSPIGSRAVLERNACGNVGEDCIVAAEGDTQRLVLGAGESLERQTHFALRISSEQMAGGQLIVLPDAVREYTIQFDPRFSVRWADGNTVRLIPSFRVSPQRILSD